MTISNRERKFIEILVLFFAVFWPLSGGSGNLIQNITSINGNIEYWIFSLPRIALILYFMHITDGFSVFSIGRPNKRTIPWIIVILAGVILIEFIITFFFNMVNLFLQESQKGFTVHLSPEESIFPVITVIAVSSLMTGYLEELFYRSFIISSFESLGFPLAATLLFQAFLFAFPHFWQGPRAVLISASVSVVFFIGFRKSRDIHALAIAHGIHNFFVLCLALFKN